MGDILTDKPKSGKNADKALKPIFSSFRCVGDKCDLLISASCKDDLVRWMNAASLASIGYRQGLKYAAYYIIK